MKKEGTENRIGVKRKFRQMKELNVIFSNLTDMNVLPFGAIVLAVITRNCSQYHCRELCLKKKRNENGQHRISIK